MVTSEKEDLSDVEELRIKADRLRDDMMFDVKILDWSKKGDSIEVFFEVPSGEEESVFMDWPHKPTEDNDFVRLCMNSLGLEDAEDAVMMSESLQHPVDGEYEVRADIIDGEWKLRPKWDEPFYKRIFEQAHMSEDSDESNNMTNIGVFVSFLFGPVSLFAMVVYAFLSEPGYVFNEDKSSLDVYWISQANFYGLVGTLLWCVFIFLLI